MIGDYQYNPYQVQDIDDGQDYQDLPYQVHQTNLHHEFYVFHA
jgi:hypothetical protein